jgi:hypothetical protein
VVFVSINCRRLIIVWLYSQYECRLRSPWSLLHVLVPEKTATYSLLLDVPYAFKRRRPNLDFSMIGTWTLGVKKRDMHVNVVQKSFGVHVGSRQL